MSASFCLTAAENSMMWLIVVDLTISPVMDILDSPWWFMCSQSSFCPHFINFALPRWGISGPGKGHKQANVIEQVSGKARLTTLVLMHSSHQTITPHFFKKIWSRELSILLNLFLIAREKVSVWILSHVFLRTGFFPKPSQRFYF